MGAYCQVTTYDYDSFDPIIVNQKAIKDNKVWVYLNDEYFPNSEKVFAYLWSENPSTALS